MTLEQQIWLTIVDKLTIGLLIAIAGFVLNRILENHRSAQAFRNEIAKLRVAKISEVWAELYTFESIVSQIVTQTSEIHKLYNDDPARLKAELNATIEPLNQKAVSSSNSVRDLANANQFWIGEKLYQHFRAFHANLFAYHAAFETKDIEAMKLLKTEREKMRQDVSHFLKA